MTSFSNPLWICYVLLAYFAAFAVLARSEIIAVIAIPVCLTITVFVHFEMQKKAAADAKAIESAKQEIEVLRNELERLSASVSSVKAVLALKSIGGIRD